MLTIIKIPNILMLFFLLGTAACWFVCSLDYNALLEIMSAMVVNANPRTYLTVEVHSRVMLKIKYASFLLLLMTAVIFVFKKQLNAWTVETKAGYKIFQADLKLLFINYFRSCGRYELLCMGLILSIAIFLRFYYLAQPIRNDEALVFQQFAKQPFLVLISTYHNVGNHVFHTLLMHLSWLLFGDSLWALRLPVFVSGILLLPIAFLSIRSVYGLGAAVVSSALIASSSTLVEYSANSRGYEVQALIIISLFALGLYLMKNTNRFGWVLWVILTGLGFWTVPTMFYAYGGLALWFMLSLFIDPDLKHRLMTFRYFVQANIMAAVLSLILYSPILILYGLGGMTEMMDHAVPVEGLAMRFILSLKETWLRNVPEIFQNLLVALSLTGIVFQYKLSKNRLNLFFCSIIWLCISGLIIPLYAVFTGYTRLWVAHSLFFYISIGIAASVFCQWLFANNTKRAEYCLMLLALSCTVIFSLQEIRHQYIHNIMQDSFHDASEVARYLQKNLQPEDYVYAVCPYGNPLSYELEKLNCHLAVTVTKHSNGKEIHLSALKNAKNPNTKLTKERLLVISVPEYDGFVPSSTNMDDVIRGANLENWANYGLKKLAHFSKTDIYELDFSKMQETGLVTKIRQNI